MVHSKTFFGKTYAVKNLVYSVLSTLDVDAYDILILGKLSICQEIYSPKIPLEFKLDEIIFLEKR